MSRKRNEVEGIAKDFVKECSIDMDAATQMLENKTQQELDQIHAVLKGEIEQLHLWSTVTVYIAFVATTISIIGDVVFAYINIKLELEEKINMNVDIIINLIIAGLVVAIILYVFSIIKKLKKGKYVAAFDYLESVEKYNFYSTKKKRKKEKHKQKI